MKKPKLIIFVLVVTSIAIIFLKNIKQNAQAEGIYLSQNIYNYLEIGSNQRAAYSRAIKLNQGSTANTCVYFMSEVLRENNIMLPTETSNTQQLIPLLAEKGFKKQRDYKKLMPGDIAFTTNDNRGFPTHTYVFMKWVKEGNYDYAYICDNQAKDYKDKVYHIRNISVVAKASGADKDAFAFFMRRN